MNTSEEIPQPVGPCILWTGAVMSRGYGATTRGRLAHRQAWEDANGPIPEGLTIDHLCYVPLCVNPTHLDAVTLRVNVQRAAARRREAMRDEAGRPRCARGHEQTPENVRVHVTRQGHVKHACRPCGREDYRAWYHAKKAAGENPNAASVARRTERRNAARAAKAA